MGLVPSKIDPSEHAGSLRSAKKWAQVAEIGGQGGALARAENCKVLRRDLEGIQGDP